jgi:hypothetical protein
MLNEKYGPLICNDTSLEQRRNLRKELTSDTENVLNIAKAIMSYGKLYDDYKADMIPCVVNSGLSRNKKIDFLIETIESYTFIMICNNEEMSETLYQSFLFCGFSKSIKIKRCADSLLVKYKDERLERFIKSLREDGFIL